MSEFLQQNPLHLVAFMSETWMYKESNRDDFIPKQAYTVSSKFSFYMKQNFNIESNNCEFDYKMPESMLIPQATFISYRQGWVSNFYLNALVKTFKKLELNSKRVIKSDKYSQVYWRL